MVLKKLSIILLTNFILLFAMEQTEKNNLFSKANILCNRLKWKEADREYCKVFKTVKVLEILNNETIQKEVACHSMTPNQFIYGHINCADAKIMLDKFKEAFDHLRYYAFLWGELEKKQNASGTNKETMLNKKLINFEEEKNQFACAIQQIKELERIIEETKKAKALNIAKEAMKMKIKAEKDLFVYFMRCSVKKAEAAEALLKMKYGKG